MTKYALAHHWIASYRGGERVLEQLALAYPDADIHTLLHRQDITVPALVGRTIHTSPLQKFPLATRLHRHLLPVHPWAIQRTTIPRDVDVLISSDASLIKGLDVSSDAMHVCYCHSPPRYLWEMSDAYKRSSLAARLALDKFAPMLRRFDHQAAQRVDHFVANSAFVAGRIQRYYQRPSTVIYPPVAVNEFRADRPRENFALVVSELAAYKRVDIAVEAFNKLGTPLIVIGDGSERKHLQSIAKSNVTFLGHAPFAVIREKFETAKYFIFPGIEDFGITPVEAQAAGCPVVAYRAGGALETVREHQTGVFFDTQSADSLAQCIRACDSLIFDPQVCRNASLRFANDRFRSELTTFVQRLVEPGNSTTKDDAHVSSGLPIAAFGSGTSSFVPTTSGI
jgi:glycosyltransferase involved in cell wall biosynthesis